MPSDSEPLTPGPAAVTPASPIQKPGAPRTYVSSQDKLSITYYYVPTYERTYVRTYDLLHHGWIVLTYCVRTYVRMCLSACRRPRVRTYVRTYVRTSVGSNTAPMYVRTTYSRGRSLRSAYVRTPAGPGRATYVCRAGRLTPLSATRRRLPSSAWCW